MSEVEIFFKMVLPAFLRGALIPFAIFLAATWFGARAEVSPWKTYVLRIVVFVMIALVLWGMRPAFASSGNESRKILSALRTRSYFHGLGTGVAWFIILALRFPRKSGGEEDDGNEVVY